MDKKKPQIDDLFKDKFQDFEVIPDAHLWKEISQKIPKKQKKNKPLLLWMLPIGVAASLAILITFFNQFEIKLKNSPSTPIVSNESEFCPEESDDAIKSSSSFANISTDTIFENEFKDALKNDLKTEHKNSFTPKNNKTTIPNKNLKTSGTTLARTKSTKPNVLPTDVAPDEKFVKEQKNAISPKGLKYLAFATEPQQKNTQNLIQPINSKSTKNDFLNKSNPENEDVLSALALKELLTDEKVEPTVKTKMGSWNIQPQLAPLAYNSTSGGSTINSNFSGNPQSSKTALSYGVRIAYQLSKKLQIRSGVSTVSVNLRTDNVLGTSLASNNQAIRFNNSNAVSQLIGQEAFNNLDEFTTPLTQTDENVLNASQILPDSDNKPISQIESGQQNLDFNGRLEQQIDYIEIPVEVSYKVLDKKIGVSLIGGISSFILNENNNQISFNSTENSTDVGEAKNLNKTSFSGNLGVGLDYKITPKIKLNIEPIFKLQLNAFANNTNYDPYIFGVYSGIVFDL